MSNQKTGERGLGGRPLQRGWTSKLLLALSLQTGVDPQKVLLAKQKYLRKQEKGRMMPTQQRKSLFMKTKVN